MNNSSILKLGLKLAEIHTPTANWCAIVDFTRISSEHRFFLIDIKNKRIEYEWYTSHGSGSGSTRATSFSNVPNSLKSTEGLLKTGGTYYGKNGYSLKLIGQEKGVNDNAEKRAIVIHPADYVSVPYMNTNQFPGRSWGCITLDPNRSKDIIDKLKGGSIVYLMTPNKLAAL